MLHQALSDEKFCDIMSGHIQDILEYLLDKNINFAILTNIAEVDFEPSLPNDIRDTFKPITMFVLAGYTYESALIDGETLSFEAGFGADNYGSLVSVPLLGILQIIVEDTPIFINLSIPVNNKSKKVRKKGVKKSMEALLLNPENKKLLKDDPEKLST
ncbi:MAG: hypothetical protein QM482_03355 [Sulfurospirillum sp.]